MANFLRQGIKRQRARVRAEEEAREMSAFIRFDGDAMHLDAPQYAELRGITLEEAVVELREMAARLLPATTKISEV